MKDYSYHKKVIDDVITKLNESDIDLYEGREKVSDGIQH